MKPPKEYLATAAEAYQTVISSYADVTHADIAARFGLAAIHEQRGEWDAGQVQYLPEDRRRHRASSARTSSWPTRRLTRGRSCGSR